MFNPRTIIIQARMSPRISLAQFEIQIGDPESNLKQAEIWIRQSAQAGCQLLLLPELWTSGYDLAHCDIHARRNQEILRYLRELSNRHGMVIGGSYITGDDTGFFNTFVLALPDGSISRPYHKIHLFRLLSEPQFFQPGSQPVITDLSWGIAGLAICYDLRFPELFRFYAQAGVQCILIVAQWGAFRREHWRTFLKARAIENQVFIAAVNAVGVIGDTPLAGCSTVLAPWGEVLVEASPDKSEIIFADLNLVEIQIAKSHLDSAIDRRDDLYQQWYQKPLE